MALNISKLKDYWWVACLLVGGLVFIVTLPKRLNSVEAGVKEAEKQNQEQYRILDRLTYIAEQNERIQSQQMQQQAPNQAYPQPIQRLWDAEYQAWYCDDGRNSWWETRQEPCR